LFKGSALDDCTRLQSRRADTRSFHAAISHQRDTLLSLLRSPTSHSPRALAWGSEPAKKLRTVLTVSESFQCFLMNRWNG